MPQEDQAHTQASSCMLMSTVAMACQPLCIFRQHAGCCSVCQAAQAPNAADLTAIRQSISSLLELRHLLTTRAGSPDGVHTFVWAAVCCTSPWCLSHTCFVRAGDSNADLESVDGRPSVERRALACIGSQLQAGGPQVAIGWPNGICRNSEAGCWRRAQAAEQHH